MKEFYYSSGSFTRSRFQYLFPRFPVLRTGLERGDLSFLRRSIVGQIGKEPDEPAPLPVLIDPVSDQPDRPRKNKEAVERLVRETEVGQNGRHGAVDVQDQRVFLAGGQLLHREGEVEMRRRNALRLDEADQLFHPLVG